MIIAALNNPVLAFRFTHSFCLYIYYFIDNQSNDQSTTSLEIYAFDLMKNRKYKWLLINLVQVGRDSYNFNI